MEHEVTLPRQCLRTILNVLSQNGWTDDPKLLYSGCSIFELPDFDIKKPDFDMDEEQAKKWLDELIDFKLTERQREAVKAALNNLLSKKTFGADKYIGRLLMAFGLVEE